MRHRRFRYRIYPTAGQAARLEEWQGALRGLWNLMHEQRLIAADYNKRLKLLGSDRRIYISAMDQTSNDNLTALKKVAPWFADLPSKACLAVATRLDLAWQRCFKKLGGRPSWKAKGRGWIGIEVDQVDKAKKAIVSKDLSGRPRLVFPKLGDVRISYHRPFEGRPKNATILKDRGEWYVSICCELPDVTAKATGPIVGIDRGVIDTLSDSEGRAVASPRFLARELDKLRRLQRKVSRRAVRGKPDSNRCKQARAAVARQHATMRTLQAL